MFFIVKTFVFISFIRELVSTYASAKHCSPANNKYFSNYSFFCENICKIERNLLIYVLFEKDFKVNC